MSGTPFKMKGHSLPGPNQASPAKHPGEPGAEAHTHEGPVTKEQSEKGVTPGSEIHRSYVSGAGNVSGKKYKTITSGSYTSGRKDYVTKDPSYERTSVKSTTK